MSIKELQQKLLAIVSSIVIENNDEAIKTNRERALKVINELRDHINDDIGIDDNLRITILDCIVRFDSQGSKRLNNKSLLDLENVVKSIGGKTSKELGQEQNVKGLQISDENINRFVEQFRRIQENLDIDQLGHTDERQKSCGKAMKFYALVLSAFFGAFIVGGLARGFRNDTILGLEIGALAGMIVIGVPLVLYFEKNHFLTSTSLESITIEQPNIQPGQNR